MNEVAKLPQVTYSLTFKQVLLHDEDGEPYYDLEVEHRGEWHEDIDTEIIFTAQLTTMLMSHVLQSIS